MIIIIKYIVLIGIFIISTLIGIQISNSFKNRVKDLKEIKNGLNIFETKIKFTYEPLPEMFREISENLTENVGNMFKTASYKMLAVSAGKAWEEAVDLSVNSLNNEDREIIKKMGKLLGKTDVEGQVSEIQLTKTFVDTQILKAEEECNKSSKLYKTLGMVTGLGLVIILI